MLFAKGFRDSIEKLENYYKYRVMVPAFIDSVEDINKRKNQLTTAQTSWSRLVTKVIKFSK